MTETTTEIEAFNSRLNQLLAEFGITMVAICAVRKTAGGLYEPHFFGYDRIGESTPGEELLQLAMLQLHTARVNTQLQNKILSLVQHVNVSLSAIENLKQSAQALTECPDVAATNPAGASPRPKD